MASQIINQNTRNARTTNSLVDFMFVAEGKFGGCINLFTRIWDIAAPYLIIKEAGGVIKELNGKEIIFEINEKSTEMNYGIITGAESIIKRFDKILAEKMNFNGS